MILYFFTIPTTGWRTDELRVAVENADMERKYDLVTLLIGVNDQYQNKPKDNYKSEFLLCLNQAISYATSKDNVVIVSIPDYGYTPFGQTKDADRISSEIDFYNQINRQISAEIGIKYVDITDITRKGLEIQNLVVDDGLHPSGMCYGLFILRIMKVLGL